MPINCPCSTFCFAKLDRRTERARRKIYDNKRNKKIKMEINWAGVGQGEGQKLKANRVNLLLDTLRGIF
jgi:hypothetical protein